MMKTKFSISADVIQKHIMEKLQPQDQSAVTRVVAAGMKVLFDERTNKQLFGSIRPNVPLEDELGSAAVGLMMMLYNQSNQSIPAQALIPAGTILLAKACEFINQAKIAPITDNDYSEALQMFVAVMYRKFGVHQTQKSDKQPNGILARR